MSTWEGQGEKGKKNQDPSLQIQMLKLADLGLLTGHTVSTWVISADESKNIQDTGERRQAVETVNRRASQISGRTAEIPGRDLEGTNNTWKLWK